MTQLFSIATADVVVNFILIESLVVVKTLTSNLGREIACHIIVRGILVDTLFGTVPKNIAGKILDRLIVLLPARLAIVAKCFVDPLLNLGETNVERFGQLEVQGRFRLERSESDSDLVHLILCLLITRTVMDMQSMATCRTSIRNGNSMKDRKFKGRFRKLRKLLVATNVAATKGLDRGLMSVGVEGHGVEGHGVE